MKTLKVIMLLAAIALYSALVFKFGQYVEFYRLKPTIAENDGGYYDTKTGEFQWGRAPYIPALPSNELDGGHNGRR